MDTLQEIELLASPEDAVIVDRAQAPVSVAYTWGAWSLVPASSPSKAHRRRLAAAARVRMNLQLRDPASPVL